MIILLLIEEPLNCFPKRLHHVLFLTAMHRGSSFSKCFSAFVVFCVLCSNGVKWYCYGFGLDFPKRNRWGNSGNSVRLYFGGAPKSVQMVTAAIKLKVAFPWKKVMTNLDSIFKSRDITLPTKVHLVKAMVSPVVMYGCESWTVKKTER